jgi:hypothetical protein
MCNRWKALASRFTTVCNSENYLLAFDGADARITGATSPDASASVQGGSVLVRLRAPGVQRFVLDVSADPATITSPRLSIQPLG